MSISAKFRYFLFGLLALSLLGTSTKASTLYTYTGNAFTGADLPYTTSDSIRGSMTLSSPLGDNFHGGVSPLSFSFTDGIQTLTSAPVEFFFVTGPTGAITQWEVVIGTYQNGITTLDCPTLCSAHPPFAQDIATHTVAPFFFGAQNGGTPSGDPGRWSNASATPLASALPFFVSGLGGLGLLGWVRKRKAKLAV